MKGRVGACRNVESMDILPTLRYFSDSPKTTLNYRHCFPLTCFLAYYGQKQRLSSLNSW